MYSGIDDPIRWTLPMVIEEQAANCAGHRFVTMVDGDAITYRELRDQAAQVAAMFAEMGAGPGERIALMLPNGTDFLRAWAGIGRLGAVAVLLNTELTGSFLMHPIADSGAAWLVIHAAWLPLVEGMRAALPALEHIIVVGEVSPQAARFDRWRDFAPLDSPLPAANQIACIMYTSGTTGPPKGVLMPHAHCFLFGLGVVENLGITRDDRYYVCLPLFHANGLLMQLGAVLIAGAHATVRERFSASSWLRDIRESGATVTHMLGAISAFVVAQEPDRQDRDHRLRLILGAPNHPDHERIWRERFGIADVLGGYGMTEVNIPLYGVRGDPRPGACGRAYARHFDVEIRDPDTDAPVPLNEIGEIMVRPRTANGFMAGYNNLPEKTVEAWRNLWFHTGDAGRMDADGYIVFIDRIKDCIRRRGENISAADIEASFIGLAGIAEVAAFAVASDIPGGEDEIMLAVVPRPGASIGPAAILAHARASMPRFAQPRYLAFVASLPRTGTEKVRKAELRKAGVTPNTIDLASLALPQHGR